MKDRECWRQIGQAMELLPSDVTEASESRVGRCRGQRNQQHKSGETEKDKFPFANIVHDCMPVQTLIEHSVGDDVQKSIEEREQAEHPPDTHRPGPTKHGFKRRACESSNQEDESDKAELIQCLRDWIGAEIVAPSALQNRRDRSKRPSEHGGLEPRDRRFSSYYRHR